MKDMSWIFLKVLVYSVIQTRVTFTLSLLTASFKHGTMFDDDVRAHMIFDDREQWVGCDSREEECSLTLHPFWIYCYSIVYGLTNDGTQWDYGYIFTMHFIISCHCVAACFTIADTSLQWEGSFSCAHLFMYSSKYKQHTEIHEESLFRRLLEGWTQRWEIILWVERAFNLSLRWFSSSQTGPDS